MSDADRLRTLLDAASASLEVSKARINDLNVYPVPDGDTGTNMALTVRGTLDGLAGVEEAERAALARAVTRAALMGARGNSGVILSQIVRGAADVLGDDVPVDARLVGRHGLQNTQDSPDGMDPLQHRGVETIVSRLTAEQHVDSLSVNFVQSDVHGISRRAYGRQSSLIPGMVGVVS